MESSYLGNQNKLLCQTPNKRQREMIKLRRKKVEWLKNKKEHELCPKPCKLVFDGSKKKDWTFV
jgi:hypothetical protein